MPNIDAQVPSATLLAVSRVILAGRMSGVMAVLKRVTGFLLVGLWLAATGFFVLALRLMSVDEEWKGWTDALPLVVLFVVLTLLVWLATWWLLRDRQ